MVTYLLKVTEAYYYHYKNRKRSTQLKKASKHYNTMQRNIKKEEKNTQFKND